MIFWRDSASAFCAAISKIDCSSSGGSSTLHCSSWGLHCMFTIKLWGGSFAKRPGGVRCGISDVFTRRLNGIHPARGRPLWIVATGLNHESQFASFIFSYTQSRQLDTWCSIPLDISLNLKLQRNKAQCKFSRSTVALLFGCCRGQRRRTVLLRPFVHGVWCVMVWTLLSKCSLLTNPSKLGLFSAAQRKFWGFGVLLGHFWAGFCSVMRDEVGVIPPNSSAQQPSFSRFGQVLRCGWTPSQAPSDQEVVHDDADIVKCNGGWVKVEACLQFWCAEFEHIIEAGTHHIS